jgi:hypothetical protein
VADEEAKILLALEVPCALDTTIVLAGRAGELKTEPYAFSDVNTANIPHGTLL